MKKIKDITLENFKFFKGAETLEFNSKNVLIYGENGSGKVSVIFSTLHAMAGRPFQYSHKPPSCLKHILRIYFWTLT